MRPFFLPLALLLAGPAIASAQPAPVVEVRTAFGISNYLHSDIGYNAPTWLVAVRIGRGAIAIEREHTPAQSVFVARRGLRRVAIQGRDGHVHGTKQVCNARSNCAIFVGRREPLMIASGCGYLSPPPHTWRLQICRKMS